MSKVEQYFFTEPHDAIAFLIYVLRLPMFFHNQLFCSFEELLDPHPTKGPKKSLSVFLSIHQFGIISN